MTISYRVRKQIVDYFAQRKSSQEIASMLNVSLDQIQDWRRRYKHGHEDWVFSDHLPDASVNFHFDATRSFHLKIGKIK